MTFNMYDRQIGTCNNKVQLYIVTTLENMED